MSFSRQTTFPILFVAISVVGITLLEASDLFAKRAPVTFGVESSLNLYPTEVTTDTWGGVDSVLIHDLDDEAIYHHFNALNAAYLRKDMDLRLHELPRSTAANETVSEVNEVPESVASSTVDNESSFEAESASTTESNEEVVLPRTDEPEDVVVPVEQTPNDGAASDTEAVGSAHGFFNEVFALASRVFPFAQESTTTPVADESLSEVLEITTTTEPLLIEEVSVDTASTTTEDVSTNSNEANIDSEAPETATSTDGTVSPVEPVATSSEPKAQPALVELEPDVESQSPTTSRSTLAAEEEVARTNGRDYEITLGGFSAPELQEGEFVTGMQLRLSLAARLNRTFLASNTIPYVEVFFELGSSSESVGFVLLDDEVSNAINGGFHLFALPELTLEELTDASVRVVYAGDKSDLDGLYLDALWIEVDTKQVTKDDLLARGSAEKVKYLKKPQYSDLVSSKTTFGRNELPVFNLRYKSQRNFVVRGIRNFIGDDLVVVENVEVTHRALGPSGINPKLVATKDGLVTVQFEENAFTRMRPGEYVVTLTFDEGGKVFTESFSFQWGILTINPNKTEYDSGEIADISMGALTLNGNTVCKANLQLYVITPNGFVDPVDVYESGLCDGNNVIDVPDFSATYQTKIPGEHELYLERLDEDGSVLSYTTDTFWVVGSQDLSIERTGPTRIYPPAPYPMELTVSANKKSFSGTLVERVPANFEVYDTDASIERKGEWYELSWDISLLRGDQETVTYMFNAPDISPYLFELGPAQLESDATNTSSDVLVDMQTATSSTPPGQAKKASSTTAVQAGVDNGVVFLEHRQWQIASDAIGNMLLFYDGTEASLPSSWDCVSCGSGDFFNNFILASSTYNSTGGATTHTHTSVSVNVNNTTSGVIVENVSGTTIAANTHNHTASITLGSASNLPSYRELRVIRFNVAAGEPTSPEIIPAGAIAIFDTTVPTGWTRYSAQDGYYIRGGDSPGTTSGSNTHTHTITSGTLNASTGAIGRRGGSPSAAAINTGHTHSVTGSSASASNEPEYIEVILGQLDADGSPVNGMIAMWDEDVDTDSGWEDISSDPSSAFSNKFLKAAATYGTTGGVNSHAHATTTVASGAAIGGTNTGRTSGASDGVAAAHTHNVDFSTSDDTHLPPYLTVVFGKRIGLDATFSQLSYRWYVDNDSETPTDPWDDDAIDLAEREPITATSTPVDVGDVVRLRINAVVNNATSSAGARFQLQFASSTVCSSATNWADVGQTGSSTVWIGHNTSVTEHITLSSTTLASTTDPLTFSENGYATGTPTDLGENEVGEWDFALENNGALPGTVYCFRLVDGTGSELFSYNSYPQLFTNEAPAAPTLSKLFDNEKTPSTTPLFEFVTTDPEGDAIHYQIQIDTDTDFSSGVVTDRNTVSHEDDFEDQVNDALKPPFTSGNLIQFTPPTSFASGTTYYWRVRGTNDATASGLWGEWSEVWSFTIDPNLSASSWFQTEDEQFDTNANVGVESGSNSLSFISGSTTGTSTSGAITFTDGSVGTAWGSLLFNDSGSITYYVEYQDTNDEWQRIPAGDLADNDIGHTASPVSLLSLDVETYEVIRLVAVFTNTVAPTLNDWEVRWGFRVDTPTITKLFPNEQVGTTTPVFEFSTTDPQDDRLTYQVQWSTDNTFTSSTTRTSDTHAGFYDMVTGSTTGPFDSGNAVQFTIQPSDALSGTTTYWWRVRAKDPDDGDAYSFWTTRRSFTVIPGTEVSTWFQTTEEQFDTDILSGTLARATDAVSVATSAVEAMLVYGEGVATIPRYRLWDGSSWGTEGTINDIDSTLRWAVVRAGTTREEYVAGTLGTDADLNLHVYSTGAWGSATEFTTSAGINSTRGFDIAYETLSGDAMVVYCDGDTAPSYRIWDGSSWSSETGITSNLTDDCRWVTLASHPATDEIALIMRGVAGDLYEVLIWNATTSTWANSSTFGTSRNSTYSGQDIMYESQSGNILAVAPSPGGGPNRFVYNAWTGSWTGGTTQTIDGRLYWAQLAQDPLSDEIVMCYQNDNSDVQAITWSGTAWATDTEFTGTANADTDPGFACVYDADNDAVGAYADGTNTDYRLWNGTSWSGTGSTILSLGTTDTMQLIRTGDGTVLGTFFDGGANDSLESATWDGSSWTTTGTLESDMPVGSSPFGNPYFMAPRNENSAGTTIVSPGVDFNDGVGPYWDNFSWNDANTNGGGSEVLYSLQYQTATGSWVFIPDSEIPGNEAGTTTGPIDLSGLNVSVYDVIRPYATLSCDGSGNCPDILDWKIEWAGGITISGTIDQYDQSTPVSGADIRVAVNGTVQTGKQGTSDGSGNWSISNVTVNAGDVVTVYVNGAAEANEAVGVTRYDGDGDISGFQLFERHVALGSNDATSTPLTNADIGGYTVSEDVFIGLSGTTLTVCADVACADAKLFINASTTYAPGGRTIMHDFVNNGTFTAGSYIHDVTGSWDNNGTTTMTGSTIVMAATSTTESIDSTGAVTSSFNNLQFGTTTTFSGAAWTLTTALDVNGDMTVASGTLARGTTAITIAGDLSTEASGYWSGIGTTTFDGATGATWSDANSTVQNVGNVVVDGANKTVTLTGNVAGNRIRIGANDTLSASSYDLTVYDDWINANNFTAGTGEVFFSGTTSTYMITTAGDAFYDLTFNGIGGAWSFTESSITVNNDLTAATGTVTFPTNGTTTIAGSFDATGGTFQHNNGTLYFTSSGAETITFDGQAFTNVARNLTFNGGGNWTITDTHATATSDVRVNQGALTFPSGVFAIGGTLADNGGSFTGNGGVARFYSSDSEVITAGGSSFASTTFDGTGDWSFSDTNVTMSGTLRIENGTTTLPSGILTLGGSYINNDIVDANSGTVRFNSTDAIESINLGGSPLYNMTFDGVGGWQIVAPATTTNNVTLTNVGSFTLNSGQSLAVGGVFTNSVASTTTTWAGSTLSLEAGNYSINTKTDEGDTYGTLRVKGNTDIAMWNSDAVAYVVDSTGSLYSQDHARVDGDLYIFGDYNRTSGTEYWAYATDFDGTDLTGSERQVDVRFATSANATVAGAILDITGDASASTTIASQGGTTYQVAVTGGTTTAQYYEFTDLGGFGLSLLGTTSVTSLRDGSYTVAENNAAAITVSADTIDANPGKQIYNVTFATTTAISATNTRQFDLAITPSSFWWFRDGSGNLYGEAFDNDTGNPGSIRFDDSALVLTLSGTVYQTDKSTPVGAATCDGNTLVIDVYVDGVFSTSTSCDGSGAYSASGVVVVGDPTITVFLDEAPGGEQGSVVTRTPTANITDLDIYQNRVIVRHEDTQPLSITNLAVMDIDPNGTDDLVFTAATGTLPDVLELPAGHELFVWATTTFTPGGEVTLNANANANSYDGTLYLGGGSTFNAYGSTTLTIGGRLELEPNATFEAASTTALFTATTSGKSITGTTPITFHDLTFNGVGGDWTLGTDIVVEEDMIVTAGTVQGSSDITVENGSLTGNGVVSLGGASVVTMESSNSLGGTSAWTFGSLTLGDGSTVGTTTPLFTATTTVSGVLTIAASHYLDAGSTYWDLSGTGSVFVENGTFLEDTSRIRYSGSGGAVTVTATRYYDLDINAGAGTPTYTAAAIGIPITNKLTVGGDAPSTFDLSANNPVFAVDGDVVIRSNGTIIASDSASFTVSGSYDNNGTLTAGDGTITFDGAGTVDIAAGNSPFNSVVISGTGDFTVSEHATATDALSLTAANTFTLGSGDVLAVGGTFTNDIGSVTTWTGSTLRLYGGGDYAINSKANGDSYATLSVSTSTQIRMWDSDATIYDVDATGSLYSMDHADNAGDLYIFGAYTKTAANDFWNYARDFDGAALGGSSRDVNVYMATSSSLYVTGGSFSVVGAAGGTTTIQSSATDLYDFEIGGTASVTMQYYAFRDMAAGGIVFSGTPDIETLSNGDFELAVTGTTTITIAGSVITANPAKTFNYNRFALGAAASGFNARVTGTALSAWRFFGHTGDIDGEDFDIDGGDPGELLWDNSTSTIDISGRVYSDEGTTVSGACTGATNIYLYVNGALEDTTSCAGGTGLYSFSDVSYNTGESVVIYINNEAQNAVTVSTDLVSSVFNYDLYEDRLIVRHESTDPIEISDLDDWDSDNDPADIFFDAEVGPDTLTLNTNTKLIIWDNKTFQPGGDITTGGGTGDALDGTVALQDDAILTLATGESHSFGGNLEMGTDATFTPGQSTVTFTSSGSGRTIDTNENGFYDLVINGTGSFVSSDTVLPIANDITLTDGALTLPSATTTITGSLSTTGGTFDANDGVVVFDSAAAETIVASTSPFADLRFTGSGSWSMNDTNATATKSLIIADGTVTFPSGQLVVGGDMRNIGGAITHNTSELIMTSTTTALLLASSSDLYAVTIAGSGTTTVEDTSITLLDTLSIDAGYLTLLAGGPASGTFSIGGSFLATGGGFDAGSTTVLFNSSDGGETINPGSSNFYSVQFGAPAGGYTVTGNATTTHNFTIANVSSLDFTGGVVWYVGNVFTNSVGGTNTDWLGSTLVLDGQNAYTINSKGTGDQYDTLTIGANSDIRSWDSAATTTVIDAASSLYSMDNADTSGHLYIYGDFHISTSTEYWSYATDFDGTNITGSERAVIVRHANGATTTVDGGVLQMVGASGNETLVENQGAGTYAMTVSAGTLNAQRYQFRDLNISGLNISGTPTLTSLNYGDFEVGVAGGTAITLASSTLNANASKIISGMQFATTTAISAYNVTRVGTTTSVWTFTSHTGNIDGEAFDVDGPTLCGSLRWDDSDCQITEQTHFRWRNDDGGINVPSDEWFDTDWNYRKRVRIENADATTYTDPVIELTVTHENTIMESNFSDLRFTDSDGITELPYWIGSTTDNTVAEVWVKIPSLPANDTATIFMYYDNDGMVSSSSASSTFLAADDFEDNNISEYSGGDTGEFTVNGTYAYDGSYGLDAVDNLGRTNGGGFYRLDQQISQGETLRYFQYIDTSAAGDEVCTLFGVQSISPPDSNYAVCIDEGATDRLTLAKDVVDDDESGSEKLASTTLTYSTGWYEFEVDWEADGDMIVSLYRNNTLVTSITGNDTDYSSGGMGFSFWINRGGWDSYSSRPTLATEPTVRFGVPQTVGGATWAADLDSTLTSASINDIVRLRVLLENSGTKISGQEFLLEYAEQGAAPSCEAVSLGNYAPVPVDASCGASPVCMATSSNVTNGASTIDLLAEANGDFTAGEAREDPSNKSASSTVAQDEYTELEYVIKTNNNVSDQNLCFRVSDNGVDYDSYLRVAKMSVRFDPSFGPLLFNNDTDITLLPGTTTRIYATSTVTDYNGYDDIIFATSTFYTASATAACTADNNDCYITNSASTTGQCSFTNCNVLTDSCELVCYADFYFHADATDSDGGNYWVAFFEARDNAGGTDFVSSDPREVLELPAITVEETIDYGPVAPESNTGGTNASTTLVNIGNIPIDVDIESSDLSDGFSSTIPGDEQYFSTSTFTYGAGGTQATTTTSIRAGVDLAKPTSDSPPVEDAVYWGIAVPFGVNSAPHTGTNIFYVVSE